MARPPLPDDVRSSARLPSVRLRQDELEKIRAAARASGQTLAEWIRGALLRAAKRKGP